jgi:hypothetical protein
LRAGGAPLSSFFDDDVFTPFTSLTERSVRDPSECVITYS